MTNVHAMHVHVHVHVHVLDHADAHDMNEADDAPIRSSRCAPHALLELVESMPVVHECVHGHADQPNARDS